MERERAYVLSGSCRVGSEIKNCALNHEQCTPDSVFLSGRKTRAIGQDCTATERILVGRCRDSGLCAATHEGCLSGHHFARSDECTITIDLKTKLPTPYGKCEAPVTTAVFEDEKGFCAWDKSDCPQDYKWKRSVNACDCSQVRTGACQYKDEFICAVSADACDELQTFRTVQELMNDESLIDCRLCSVQEEKTVPENMNVEADRNPEPGVGIELVVVLSVLFGVVFFVVTYYYKKRHQSNSYHHSSPDSFSTPSIEFTDKSADEDGGSSRRPEFS